MLKKYVTEKKDTNPAKRESALELQDLAVRFALNLYV